MALDLLVFGPHPDDIEIGLGGTVAKHVALGLRVGLCDLTAGEMGSNGTIEERLAEAEQARRVLGAEWRENLRWPDRRIGTEPRHLDEAVAFIRRHQPTAVAVPYWRRSPSRPRGGEPASGRGGVQRGLRRYPADGRAVAATVDLLLLHQRLRAAVVRHRRVRTLRPKATGARLPRSQFGAPSGDVVGTRLNSPRFRQLIESRDAQFGALAGVAWAEGVVVREPLVRDTLFREAHAMNIGIVCYASIGGSGIIATELGKTLADAGPRRPHSEQRHAVSTRRLSAGPVVSPRRDAELPAVPPAAVRAVAREQDRAGLASRAARHHPRALRDSARDGGVSGARRSWPRRPRPTCRRSSRRCTAPTSRCSAAIASYSETVAFCIEQSDGVTAVSESLKADTYRELGDHDGHPRDSELPRLLAAPAGRGARLRERSRADPTRQVPDSRLELPAGETRDGRRRDLRARVPRRAGAPADGRRRPGRGRRAAARAGRSASRTTCISSANRTRCCRCCRSPTCSCCRRPRKASGWRRSRRWRARCRWWPRGSAGCPKSIEHGTNGLPARARRSRRDGARRPCRC